MFVQCMYTVYGAVCSFPPVAEICARLAGNFCQYMTTVSCWANSLVWVSVCYKEHLRHRRERKIPSIVFLMMSVLNSV